jgi:hypothetical protein
VEQMTNDDSTSEFRIPTLSNLFDAKIALAERLHAGDCGGTYADAVLVLLAAISAGAAMVFPGLGKDKSRFIECVVRYTADVAPSPRMIALPLLYDQISKDARAIEELQPLLKRADRSVLTFAVDLPEASLLDALKWQKARLRAFSYASLLYTDFRCGLMHEYCAPERIALVPQSTTNSPVSYANRSMGNRTWRAIHFDFGWIVQVTRAVTSEVCRAMQDFPDGKQKPQQWWIEGAAQ